MKPHIVFIILLLTLNQPTTTPNQRRPDVAVKSGRPGLSQVVTSQVTGTVTDETGAVLPGVEVTLKSADGKIRITTTDNQGRYVFVAVPPGSNYRLRFSQPGFRAIERPNISVGLSPLLTRSDCVFAPTIRRGPAYSLYGVQVPLGTSL